MKQVRITVMKIMEYKDLMEIYENPLDLPCQMKVGESFISVNATKPDGLCDSAWDSMKEFVKTLAEGGGNFFDGWMKNPHSAMISCNDGFRPVSFLIETIE